MSFTGTPSGLRPPATPTAYQWLMRKGPAVPAAPRISPGRAVTGTLAAYAAAIIAFAYAAVSLYWTVGGSLLLDTVGGKAGAIAADGGVPAVLLGLTATVLKTGGGLLALALIRRWGRVIPRRWLLVCSAGASAVLTGYGCLLVAAGALVLSGTVPAAGADRTALRWHVAVWDMWFLLWGLFLAVATVACWRQPKGLAR